MARYAAVLSAVLLLLRSSNAQVTSADVTTFIGTWSDDFATDIDQETGWDRWGGSDEDTPHFNFTYGDGAMSNTYHRFRRTSSSNSDKHQYIARYFACSAESWLSVSMSISGCGVTSSEHFRVYMASKYGTAASAATYEQTLLDELSATTMTADGTMTTPSDVISECLDWSGYDTLNLTYNLTMLGADGVSYSDYVDADEVFEIYMKFKFNSGYADTATQAAHLWNFELTCNEVLYPTSSPTTGAPTQVPTTAQPSVVPTKAPTTVPTQSPTTAEPSTNPTFNPSRNPTTDPTSDPSADPTNSPTSDPTQSPSSDPTASPSSDPTTSPTPDPTGDPTKSPTSDPTSDPTNSPSSDPTSSPTVQPTTPTMEPTTAAPVISPAPTMVPTTPTAMPTSDPTSSPTSDPSPEPTWDPSTSPTTDPTNEPTSNPTADPTMTPTSPTMEPTNDPTIDPTRQPTSDPTMNPTTAEPTSPTQNPSGSPTIEPTRDPTGSPSKAPTTAQPSAEPTSGPTTAAENPGGGLGSGNGDGGSGFSEVDWRSLALGAILASLFICCLFWVLIFIFWKKRNDSGNANDQMTQMTSTNMEAGV